MQFARDTRGSVAILFAACMLPVLGIAGAAIDYSRASSTRAAMQAAADATALMLVHDAATLSNSELTQRANNHFKALFTQPEAKSVNINASYDSAAHKVTVTASGSIETAFMKIVGIPSMDIGSGAAAAKAPSGQGCVLALHPSASGAVTTQGNPSIHLTGCSLYSNSTSSSAVTVGGSATLSALTVGVVGGISGAAKITTTQPATTGISPIADPYETVAMPSLTGCTQTNFSANDKVTINPGVYCNGMQLNAKADVTLNPGIYFLDRGSLSVNGSAAMHGTGVTLVFTSSTGSNWATATINGGAVVNLTPPTTGPTAGIVMFGDRRAPLGTSFQFNGGSSQYLGGAVYLPRADVSYAGGASSSSSCTQLIASTVSFKGNADFALNCSGYGTKSIGPSVIRLIS